MLLGIVSAETDYSITSECYLLFNGSTVESSLSKYKKIITEKKNKFSFAWHKSLKIVIDTL